MLEIKKPIEKAGKISLDEGKQNLINYDISKIEVILFCKAQNRKLVK